MSLHPKGGSAILCLLLFISSAQSQPIREVVELSSNWQGVWQDGRQTGENVPQTGWAKMDLPTCSGGKSLWLKRTIDVPESWRGRRIAVWLDSANYTTKVWVNGKLCGTHDGGVASFAIDIDQAVTFGRKNELHILVATPAVNDNGLVADCVPYGMNWMCGVFGPIQLHVTNPTYIDDVFVIPSLRHHQLEIRVSAGGKTTTDTLGVRFEVKDATDSVVLRSETVGLDSARSARLTKDWPNPHLWNPDAPYLYRITVSLLRGATVIDEKMMRFGFREFRTEGSHFVLNGRRINLRGDGWHHLLLYTRQKIQTLFTPLKAAGINIYRGHGPHENVWLDTADEMGMLLVAEGPAHQMHGIDADHPDFPANGRRTFHDWVRRVRNHPSVVIYSANNEIVNGYEAQGGYAPEKEAEFRKRKDREWVLRFEKWIREADPTRPIMHEGDGELTGMDDIVNFHYPHEAPFWNLYPNTTYWTAESPGDCAWKYKPWTRRQPLYVGEFGRNYEASPRSAAMMVGEAAYADVKDYYRGLGEIMRQAIIGFRNCDVPGIAPWSTSQYAIGWDKENQPTKTELYKGIAAGFKPEAVFVKEYNTRFYSGQTATRTLQVFNDSLTDKQYEIRWYVSGHSTAGTKEIPLNAGRHTVVPVSVQLPATSTITDRNFTVELRSGGNIVDTVEQAIRIFPHDRLSRLERDVLVVDTAGRTAKSLKTAGLKCRTLHKVPAAIQGDQVIIVGNGELSKTVAAECEALARAGHHVIILPQVAWPERWLGLSSPKSVTPCTLAFGLSVQHPAFSGLRPQDLCYWSSDHVVCRTLMFKPAGGPLQSLAESAGNRLGLKFTALAQGQIGRGMISVLAADIGGKLATEPSAAQLLANLIDQPIPSRPRHKPVVITRSEKFATLLKNAGLKTFESHNTIPTDGNVIILDGGSLGQFSSQEIARLRDRARQGASLLVTAVGPKDQSKLSALLGQPVTLTQRECFQLCKTDAARAILGLSNDDLCWVIYDEWGSEYRNQDNKRWPIVDCAFAPGSISGEPLLITAQVIIHGIYYGDGIREPAMNGFNFTDDPLVAMARVHIGQGNVYLCQIKFDGAEPDRNIDGKNFWDQEHYSHRDVCARVLAAILANLNVELF